MFGMSVSSDIVDDFVAPVCSAYVDILYQDEDILMINKPSGLLSLSGKSPLNWDSVHYRLVNGQAGVSPSFPDAKLPHRLDFGTSGIMVVALNAAASRNLNRQFQERLIEKRYLAVLEGWLADDCGQITGAIFKDKASFPRVNMCDVRGKAAISEYIVLQRLEYPKRSLVQFIPHTGRTHQLRAHSLSIGHPILGCDLYRSGRSRSMSDRLLLHASDVYFEHPTKAKKVHGFCPCPF